MPVIAAGEWTMSTFYSGFYYQDSNASGHNSEVPPSAGTRSMKSKNKEPTPSTTNESEEEDDDLIFMKKTSATVGKQKEKAVKRKKTDVQTLISEV
jgi:hypothetical protein